MTEVLPTVAELKRNRYIHHSSAYILLSTGCIPIRSHSRQCDAHRRHRACSPIGTRELNPEGARATVTVDPHLGHSNDFEIPCCAARAEGRGRLHPLVVTRGADTHPAVDLSSERMHLIEIASAASLGVLFVFGGRR
jgi:hypothetical protein